MPKKSTTEEFVVKAKLAHGNKFDYSVTEYTGVYNLVKIKCPIHGIFDQVAHNHLKHHGCQDCAGNIKLNNNIFISQSRKSHGTKFDYSKVKYNGIGKCVIIICPIHGEFLQRPGSHIRGDGCPKCAPINRPQNIPKTTEQFIVDANEVHNNKWNYSEVIYIDAHTLVNIICNKHGVFPQKPYKHLRGQGCPDCNHIISKPEKEFLNYCRIIDRQKYINPYRVDGIKGNKIFEFLGDYWHGNPKKYNSTKINGICHKTFGELYNNTITKFTSLKDKSFDIYYIWESDWNLWKKNKSLTFPLKKYKVNTKI